jgi:hypothetical protein
MALGIAGAVPVTRASGVAVLEAEVPVERGVASPSLSQANKIAASKTAAGMK